MFKYLSRFQTLSTRMAMSSQSLQDILTNEPGIAAVIAEMSELIPGVPASQANLKTLLEYVVKQRQIWINDSDDIMIEIVVPTRHKKKELLVSVHSKRELWCGLKQRSYVWCNSFECTEDGLLKALFSAKQNRKRYKEEGACLDCDRSGGNEPPRKKGMPKCENCMLKAIVA